MRHVMLDLETMGTRPGSAITQIGAVQFDPATYKFGRAFYMRVDLASAVECGLRLDPDTVKWWLTQSDAARGEFAKPGEHLGRALMEFAKFLGADSQHTRIWGNGAAFDNALLAEAYAALGLKAPWRYSNERCYRTLKNIYRQIEQRDDVKIAHCEALGLDLSGVKDFVPAAHNALYDAISQANHLLRIQNNVNLVLD